MTTWFIACVCVLQLLFNVWESITFSRLKMHDSQCVIIWYNHPPPLRKRGKEKNLTIVTDQCQRQTPCRKIEGSCSSSGAAMLAIQTHTCAQTADASNAAITLCSCSLCDLCVTCIHFSAKQNGSTCVKKEFYFLHNPSV